MQSAAPDAPAGVSVRRPPFPPVFYLSLLATVFFAFGAFSLIPVNPLYVTDGLGASERWIGTTSLVVSFAAVAARIPGGTLSDRQGRRKVMLLGAALGAASAVITLAGQNLALFMAGRALFGAGLAVFTTAGKALAADLAPDSRRGEALGLTNAAFALALIVSPLLGEGIQQALGFRGAFAASGLCFGLAFAASWPISGDRPAAGTSPGAWRDIQATFARRGMWAAVLVIVGLTAIFTLMITFYPLLAERVDLFGDAPDLLAPIAMGLGLAIWALVDTVIEPLAGRFSDRVGRPPIMVPGLIVALAGAWSLSQAESTWAAYLAIGVMALGWGAARAVAESLSQDALPPALRGMGAAVLYTCFDLAVGSGAQFLSALIEVDDFSGLFRGVIGIVAVFGAAGVLLALRRAPEKAREVVPAGR